MFVSTFETHMLKMERWESSVNNFLSMPRILEIHFLCKHWDFWRSILPFLKPIFLELVGNQWLKKLREVSWCSNLQNFNVRGDYGGRQMWILRGKVAVVGSCIRLWHKISGSETFDLSIIKSSNIIFFLHIFCIEDQKNKSGHRINLLFGGKISEMLKSWGWTLKLAERSDLVMLGVDITTYFVGNVTQENVEGYLHNVIKLMSWFKNTSIHHIWKESIESQKWLILR